MIPMCSQTWITERWEAREGGFKLNNQTMKWWTRKVYSEVTTWKTLWEAASEGCQTTVPTSQSKTPVLIRHQGTRQAYIDEAAPRFHCPYRKTYSELCTVTLSLSLVTSKWRHRSGMNGSSRLAQGKILSKSSHSCALKIHMPKCLVYQGSKKLCPS